MDPPILPLSESAAAAAAPVLTAPSLATIPTHQQRHREKRAHRPHSSASSAARSTNSPAQLHNLLNNKPQHKKKNNNKKPQTDSTASTDSNNDAANAHLNSFPAFLERESISLFNLIRDGVLSRLNSTSGPAVHSTTTAAAAGGALISPRNQSAALAAATVPRRVTNSNNKSKSLDSFESGNETDLEETAEDALFWKNMRAANEIAGIYENEEEEEEGKFVASNTPSSSSSSSKQGSIPCMYASYGCESKLIPGAEYLHYADHSAAEHHLSLMQAHNSVLLSQKKQLASLLQRENQEKEKLARKLERREQKYNQLKEAYARKKQALAAASSGAASNPSSELHSLQDLVASYVVDEFNPNAGEVIRTLQSRLKEAQDQVRMRDDLLKDVVKALQQQQAQQQQQQQQHVSQRSEGQQSKAAETESHSVGDDEAAEAAADSQESSAEELDEEETVVRAPLQLNFAPSPLLISTPAPSLTMPQLRVPAPQLGTTETKLQRAARIATIKAQQALKRASKEAAQHGSPYYSANATQSGATSYYSVPHSSLKALAPFLNSSTFTSIISAATAAPPLNQIPTPQQQQHEAPAVTMNTEPGQIPKSKFCPKNWQPPARIPFTWSNNAQRK